MIGSQHAFADIFSQTGADDIEGVIPVMRAAVREGLGVVLIEPRRKEAICTLHARELRKADEAAQLAGRRRHECGVKHAMTDIAEVSRVMNRMRKRYDDPPPNLAIVPGLSGLISVDVDTPAQLDAFRRAWAEGTDDERYLTAAPTITSPGSRGPDGEMAHHGGGHFHLVVPDDFDPDSYDRDKLVHPDGWVAEYGDSVYLLVPPSVREEGPYRITGDVYEAPEFLLDLIDDQQAGVAQRRAESASRTPKDADDEIEVWVREDHFEDILAVAGWTEAGSAHNCGCPDWTRPGDWTHPVSATLHRAGCIEGVYTLDEGVQVLHIWTDDPQEPFNVPVSRGERTFTQLDAYAWVYCGGDRVKAMRKLGLASNRPKRDIMTWVREHKDRISPNGDHPSTSAETDDGLLDLDEFLHEPVPPDEMVIPGLLGREDRVILTGGEGDGKSTLLRQLGVQAASGVHPFMLLHYEPIRVLLFDLENPRSVLHRSLGRMRVVAGERYDERRCFVVHRPEGMDLQEEQDREWLHQILSTAQPDLVIIGPQYKLVGGDPREEELAALVARRLDDLRTEFRCALMMEAHQPHEPPGSARRSKRPINSSVWRRWPEVGLHLAKDGQLSHWRGPRVERKWASQIKRGTHGQWPWMPGQEHSDELWNRIVVAVIQLGYRPSYRDLADILGIGKSTVSECIQKHRAEWEAFQ